MRDKGGARSPVAQKAAKIAQNTPFIILAPKILFTYRVWGATRMGDRSVDVDTTALGEVKPEAIQRVTEDALGLYCSGLYTVDKAHYEVGADIWSSIEGTEAMDREIEIPISRVVRRASRMAFDECATYFTCLRDSRRNVLLDIDTFVEERKLLSSDVFRRGLAYVAAVSRGRYDAQLSY